jgi:hypothetical protein
VVGVGLAAGHVIWAVLSTRQRAAGPWSDRGWLGELAETLHLLLAACLTIAGTSLARWPADRQWSFALGLLLVVSLAGQLAALGYLLHQEGATVNG